MQKFVHEIARAADLDQRTCKKYLFGVGAVYSNTAQKIEPVLRERGLDHLLRKPCRACASRAPC